MPNIFHYEGRDVEGNAVNGNVEVNTVDDVVVHLKKYNIVPLNIYPVKQNAFKLSNLLPIAALLHRVAPYHTMNFFRQLAILIDAGLPLIKAINLDFHSAKCTLIF